MSPNPAVLTWPRAVVSGWTPASLTGLAAWFDASDSATITESGGLVSQWADKSGNAAHATAISAWPTFVATGRNGLGIIRFGGGSMLAVPYAKMPTAMGEHTVFAVSSLSQPPDVYGHILHWYDGVGAFGVAAYGSPTRPQVHMWNSPGSSPYAAAISLNEWYVTSTKRTGSTTAIFKNGTAGTTSTLTPPAALGVPDALIGSRIFNPPAEAWTGDISEIIVCSGSLSTADQQAAESYLMTKWGIA